MCFPHGWLLQHERSVLHLAAAAGAADIVSFVLSLDPLRASNALEWKDRVRQMECSLPSPSPSSFGSRPQPD